MEESTKEKSVIQQVKSNIANNAHNHWNQSEKIKETSTEQFESIFSEAFSKQQLTLREEIKNKSFILLWVELLFIVGLILLQGFGWFGFFLNDWVIGIFANACLLQTFLIIRYITLNLFPNHYKKAKTQEIHTHHHTHH